MIHPLFLAAGILVFLIVIYILFSSRKFEKKVFRVDSDNVTWVCLAIGLFLAGSLGLASADWDRLFSRGSAYTTGYLIGLALFYLGAYIAIKKAQKIAKEKVKG